MRHFWSAKREMECGSEEAILSNLRFEGRTNWWQPNTEKADQWLHLLNGAIDCVRNANSRRLSEQLFFGIRDYGTTTRSHLEAGAGIGQRTPNQSLGKSKICSE